MKAIFLDIDGVLNSNEHTAFIKSFITYGDKFNPQAMYQEYAMVIRILLKKIKDKFPNYLSLVNELGLDNLVNYNQAEDALEVLDEFTK